MRYGLLRQAGSSAEVWKVNRIITELQTSFLQCMRMLSTAISQGIGRRLPLRAQMVRGRAIFALWKALPGGPRSTVWRSRIPRMVFCCSKRNRNRRENQMEQKIDVEDSRRESRPVIMEQMHDHFSCKGKTRISGLGRSMH